MDKIITSKAKSTLVVAAVLSITVLYLAVVNVRGLQTSRWKIEVCWTGPVPKAGGRTDHEIIDRDRESAKGWPLICNSSYRPFTHLRTKTAPLDFQWLALHSSAVIVTLKGPGGTAVPLQKQGTLPFFDNTVYTFPQPEVSGEYQLFVSNETLPISSFALHPHGCSCTQSLGKFSDRYGCSPEAVRIVRESIARWPKSSVTREIFEHPNVHNYSRFIHFAVINNKLYCKKIRGQACPPPSHDEWRILPMVDLLHRVLRRVKVPDVWLSWNLEDGPVLPAYAIQPMFSPSSTGYHRDFLLPNPYMVTDKSQGMDVLTAVSGPPWEERIAKAYFIGSPTGGPVDEMKTVPGAHRMNPRMHAAELSKERPDLLDVTVAENGILQAEAFPVLQQLLATGVLQAKYSPSRASEFKYILDLPGNSAAWRLANNLGYGAMTIKNKTPYHGYWHYLLKDGRNVRWIEDMLGDLFDVVEDSQRRDDEMKCIAREAQLTALLDLRQEDLLCWTAHSLVELSSIMAFVPTLTDDMVEVPDQHLQDASTCKFTC